MDVFDNQDFYELCQAYRHSVIGAGETAKAFEAVKEFARRELANAREDAARYRALRAGATNHYPYPFIAVRDPRMTVVQLSGEFADNACQRLIDDTEGVVKQVIDAALSQSSNDKPDIRPRVAEKG